MKLVPVDIKTLTLALINKELCKNPEYPKNLYCKFEVEIDFTENAFALVYWSSVLEFIYTLEGATDYRAYKQDLLQFKGVFPICNTENSITFSFDAIVLGTGKVLVPKLSHSDAKHHETSYI